MNLTDAVTGPNRAEAERLAKLYLDVIALDVQEGRPPMETLRFFAEFAICHEGPALDFATRHLFSLLVTDTEFVARHVPQPAQRPTLKQRVFGQ